MYEYTLDDTEQLHRLFQVLKQYIWSSGGDGDAFVLAHDYKSLADQFEKYENSGERWLVSRWDSPTNILFSSGQECLCFTGTRKDIPCWAGIIVEFSHCTQDGQVMEYELDK